MDQRTRDMHDRVDRANVMIRALKAETDRGSACVGDAFIDELLKELFRRRLIDRPKEGEEHPGLNRTLGSFAHRLQLAHLLGWTGEETYCDGMTIHKIRNEMAHNLDVDSFDHAEVKRRIDALRGPSQVKFRLVDRRDKFFLAVQFAVLRIWELLEQSENATVAADAPISPLALDDRG